jgi:phospholipid/cholesterol/gamma-HCH transport system substrate-binding protein
MRVGLFVLVCLAVVAGLVWKFGKLSPSTGRRYPLVVTFENVSGLIPDANVMYAGVSVGKVREIKLDDTGKFRALVTLGISEGTKIRRDAKFVINQSGLLGDRYVDIVPGAGDAEPLKPGETVAGTTSVDLTEVIRSVVDVLHQAGGTIERVNGMLQRIDGAIKRVDEITLSTQNLNHVSSTLAQIDVTTSNAAGLTGDLRGLVKESRGSVTNTLAVLSAASENVRGTTRRVDDFVRDAQGDVKQLMKNLDESTKNLTESTQRLNAILLRLEKGEGTAGKLLTDTALYNELMQVLRNLEQYGLFYKTWLGPKVRPEGRGTTTETPRRPSTLEPPPGGLAPVPARPAATSMEGRQ